MTSIQATSALDNKTEQLVGSSIRRASKHDQKTSVMVAHRLSTVTHADVIFVVHRGRIVEQGSHQELMDAKGMYMDMIIAQQSSTE